MDGRPAIDADAHVMEPDDLWLEHIDAEFADRAPRRVARDGMAWGQMLVDGAPMYRNYPDELVTLFQRNTEEGYPDAHGDGFSPASYVRALDAQGLDMCYLYPSLGLATAAIDGLDPALAWAIVRAYNDWLAKFVAHDPGRLRPVALVSLHSAEFAAREVDRVVDDLAITSVIVRPNPVDGRPVGHPDHEPFWARCEERGVSVSLHEGCHTMLPAAGADRFTSHFAMHACCHPIEQMMAFVSLVESGTFERHPGLRVGFMESGGGWVPYLLWRLDDLEYKHWRFQVPEVKRKPSEYFHRQCYVSVEACEPYLPRLIDELGADRLLFATDFPHPDHTFGEEIADLRKAPIDEHTRSLMLRDNPARFYGLT